MNKIANPNFIVAGQKLRVPGGSNDRHAPASSLPSTSGAQVEPILENQAAGHGVSTSLVKAVAMQESGWQQDAISSTGAIGVMQVMPGTADYVNDSLGGGNLNVRKTDDNVHLGVMYLDHMLDTMGGNEKKALAAYYTGPGNVGSRLSSIQRAYVRSVQALKRRF
jgi:soluble lytic murein transglycosylase-like protein